MDTFLKRIIQRGSPFELQDAVINGIPCKIFPRGPQTLQDVFMKATSFAQCEFIVSENTRMSFRQALVQANQFAYTLRQQYGVLKGSRVALLMEKCPEWAVAFMAIYFAGAVAVTVQSDDATQAVLTGFDDANCALIITDWQSAEKHESILSSYPVVVIYKVKYPKTTSDGNERGNLGSNSTVFTLPEVTRGESALQFGRIPRPAPDDEALITFTSGTTGPPKGVLFSHRNMTTGLMNMMLGGILMSSRAAKNRTGDKTVTSNLPPCSLLLSPLSHFGGYAQLLLMCYLGGKIVLMSRWDVHQALTLIERERVRSLNGASPSMIRELLRVDHTDFNLRSLTNLNIYGAALKESFIREVMAEFPYMNIGTGYGMTETCGSVSNVSGTELLKNPGTSGQVLPSVDIKVIDDAGRELSREELGEICIRGAMVMERYCIDSNITAEVIKNGWLRTGDMGRLDSDGHLYITDRLDEVIFWDNNRISAGELERLACEHHMIDEAIVLGLPSVQYCENIVLAALPRNQLHIDERELKRELSLRMANLPFAPKIIFYKSFPRTVSGKVNRNELRRQVMAEF